MPGPSTHAPRSPAACSCPSTCRFPFNQVS